MTKAKTTKQIVGFKAEISYRGEYFVAVNKTAIRALENAIMYAVTSDIPF